MNEITLNGTVLARHIVADDWADGLSFFSKDEEFIQVGTWRYDAGKMLQKHYHNEFARTATRTYEVLSVISGSISAAIFTLDGQHAQTLTVHSGEALILLESMHAYEILENGTRVLEVKTGPYLGPDKDRTRVE